jgi:hypothetical protein
MATMRPVMVGLGELKVVVKAGELTSLGNVRGCEGRGKGEDIPAHKTIIVSYEEETKTGKGGHGCEEESAFERSHVDEYWG